MPIKFFCNCCGKEMWQGLDRIAKDNMTITEAEKTLQCSDCILIQALVKEPTPNWR